MTAAGRGPIPGACSGADRTGQGGAVTPLQRLSALVTGAPHQVWLGVAGAGFLAAAVEASSDNGPVLCLFRRCTGGYCPACGLTRAAGRLVRGDVVGSWHQHPFLLLAAIETVLAAMAWSLRRGPLAAGWAYVARHQNRLVVLNGVGLLALWLVRLALGDVPAPFA